MRFSCNFLRLVEVNQEAETQSIRSLQRKNEHQKYGVLKYDFKIEHVPDGGRIQIRIEPKHQIKEILARYIAYNQCTVKLRFFFKHQARVVFMSFLGTNFVVSPFLCRKIIKNN